MALSDPKLKRSSTIIPEPIRGKTAGTKAKFPMSAQPILATLTQGVQNDERYSYEIKWDGYRIMGFVQRGKVRLASRGGKDYTIKYPPVVNAIKALKKGCGT